MRIGNRRWFGPGRVVVALGIGLALFAVGGGRAGADGVAAQKAPEAAGWVADDAVIYLEMAHPSTLIDRLSDKRLRGALAAIPSVRKAIEGAEYGRLKAVAEAIAGKLGTTYDQALRDITGGGVVFAVEADQGNKARALLVVTPTDPAMLKKALDAILDLARQDAASKGNPDPVKSGEYRGVTGYAVGNVRFAILKDRLVIVNGNESAHAVVDRVLDGFKGSVADSDAWKSRRADVKADALAWAVARTDRLRELDPKRFGGTDAKPKPPAVLLLGGWIEVFRKTPEVSASVTWTEARLAADLSMPVVKGGTSAAFKGFFPPNGTGAPALLNPPGTVASVGLWRDLSALWEARTDLLPPEAAQNLNQLDTVAGQFFGGRDFGTGVLGALGNDWRLVVALQDEKSLNPVPDVRLPAFALVVGLKPDDDDFAQRLKVAFQSFIGVVNLNSAQTKAPPLELGSESFEGVTISTSRYMAPKPAPGAEATATKDPVPTRHNFSPSTAQVGDHFVISSSVGLARDLVTALKSPTKKTAGTLAAEADGDALSRLVELNRSRLVMQNMLEKGHDKAQAEGEVDFLASFLRYINHGRLSVVDGPDATRVGLEFLLGR